MRREPLASHVLFEHFSAEATGNLLELLDYLRSLAVLVFLDSRSTSTISPPGDNGGYYRSHGRT